MSLEEFAQKLQQDINEYNAFRVENAITASLDLIALNKLRVQTSGLDSENESFDPYTPGYAERRSKDGFQTDIVDFTKTGKLMSSIVPFVIAENNEEVIIEIKPNNRQDQLKVNGAFAKRGNILLNTEEEYEIAFRAYDERASRKLETLIG